MSINTYMNFPGTAKEAMFFYSKVLKTEQPSIMYFRDMPADPNFPVPEECMDWVMHGSIIYNDQLIMFSDVLPSTEYKLGNHMSILIDLEDDKELKNLFDGFNVDATITMPFGPKFWAKAFGSLIDKYGIEWQFNSSLDE